MAEKFCFCLPLRNGNMMLAYLTLIISIAVIIGQTIFYLYAISEVKYAIASGNFNEMLDEEGLYRDMTSDQKEAVGAITIVIMCLMLADYIFVFFLLLIFSVLYIIGVHTNNGCLVRTFFVYSFIHLVFTLGPIAWEAYIGNYLEVAVWIIGDFVHIACLVWVNAFVKQINSGNVYGRPVIYKA